MKLTKAEPGQEWEIQGLSRHYPTDLGFVSLPEIMDAINRTHCNVWLDEGRVVGYVVYRTRIRDGVSAVYSLAIHPAYQGQGFGAKLIRSVPAPIVLKIPIDSLANGFYALLGFSWDGLYEGRVRTLNKWRLNTHFVFCFGGNKAYRQEALRAHVAFGSRLDGIRSYNALETLDMLDAHWEKPDFAKLLHTTQALYPNRVVAMNYMNPDEKGEMLRRVAAIRESVPAARVIVVPKFKGAVSDIPSDVVVGVSIPTQYTGFTPEPFELQGRRLHFLGGSPAKQRKYRKYYEGVIVESVDTSHGELRAKWGDYYTERGTVHHTSKKQYPAQILRWFSLHNLKRFYADW